MTSTLLFHFVIVFIDIYNHNKTKFRGKKCLDTCPYKVCIQNQFGGSQIFFGVSFCVCYRLPTIKSKHKNKGTNVVKRLILVSVNI